MSAERWPKCAAVYCGRRVKDPDTDGLYRCSDHRLSRQALDMAYGVIREKGEYVQKSRERLLELIRDEGLEHKKAPSSQMLEAYRHLHRMEELYQVAEILKNAVNAYHKEVSP